MTTKEKTPMITKSRLKSERGWTDKLIKMFLPEPNLIKPNPNYINGPPMLLFALDRIEKIESTEEFKAQQLQQKTRTSSLLHMTIASKRNRSGRERGSFSKNKN